MSHSSSSTKSTVPSGDELTVFKRQVAGWFEMDNRIRQYERVAKGLREEKKELVDSILAFMESHELTDLNTPNGRLRYSIQYVSQPLTKTTVATKVKTFFDEMGIRNSEERTTELVDELYKNREKRRTVQLKRSSPKPVKEAVPKNLKSI